MSEVKLQPGPGVTRAGGVDSVDTGTVWSLRGSDHVSILSTDHLTAPPRALTLTACTGWRWSCDSCELCTLSQAARPTPPRPPQHRPASFTAAILATPAPGPRTSCHGDTCHQCHQLHRSALHAHSISASTVSTVRCVYLLAGVRVCSTHCLELVVMLVVFTVMPRESSGHELPARWLEQHCQPAQPSPHCRPACCLAAWAVPPRAIQRSVQCTPYTTMQ